MTRGERRERQVSSSLYLTWLYMLYCTMDGKLEQSFSRLCSCSILTSEFMGSGCVC